MTKYPGYRHMTGAQRRNARMDRIFDDARQRDADLVATAMAAGWFLDTTINKWRHPASTAAYCDTPRWGRYACEDHDTKPDGVK